MARWIALFAVATLVLAIGAANADVYGSMTSPSWATAQFVDDADADRTAGGPGREISDGIWWQRTWADGQTWDYYRMDLANAPVSGTAGDGWAEVYGFYIDGIAGQGGDGSTLNYAPAEFSGIDFIVDVHWTDPGSGPIPTSVHFHTWDDVAGAFDGFDNYDANNYRIEYNLDGTNQFEWRIATSLLPTYYDFGAATIEQGDANDTWDYVEYTATPEPASMALMGLGVLGLAALRKRRKES